MKQPKKLSLANKSVCTNHGLIASQWMLVAEEEGFIKVIHKDTGRIRILDKYRKRI